jgi:hypothetical protein
MHVWDTVTFDTGAQLLARCDDAGCHVLRSVSADGIEALSTSEAWETDPTGELTRLLDILSGGRPQDLFSEYGWETALSASSSRALHVQASAQPAAENVAVNYVRVCERDGEEIAYWSSDEWAEDPQLVIGALVGALEGIARP